MNKEYTISLDIGVASVGWAVINDDFTLAKGNKKITTETGVKKSRTNLWGVRLFESGNTAEERRKFRGTRRRLARRNKRLKYLRDIFEPEILQFDDSFFIRLQESFYKNDETDSDFPKNKSIETKYPLFHGKKGQGETYEDDLSYFKKYPTIYHLRNKLISDKSQKDLRLVYLAVHHILKYRGHFIDEDRQFTFDHINIESSIDELLLAWNTYFVDKPVSTEHSGKIQQILEQNISPSKKVDYILGKAKNEDAKYNINNFKSPKAFEQILKLAVGNQGNLKNVFQLNSDLKIKFSDHDFNEDISVLDDDQQNLILCAQKVNNDMLLSRSLSQGSLSNKKVADYDLHRKQLQDLREYLIKYPELYEAFFGLCVEFKIKSVGGIKEAVKKNGNKGIYTKYIQGTGKDQNVTYQTNIDGFYDAVRKAFKKEKVTMPEWMEEAMQAGDFLPKQRLYKNGSIPYQVHYEELKKIIMNQSKYYPFLCADKEGNLTDEIDKTKIAQLMKFRIPYYVGTLAKNVGWKEVKGELIKQKGKNISSNSWVVRKSDDKLTPWNFDEVIDKDKSAMNFIKRMTNFDTYLPSEKVLPIKSMIYQKYNVLNRLTKVKINDEWLSPQIRLIIFNELFAGEYQTGKVSKNDLVNFYACRFNEAISTDVISGLDGRGFLETYTTIHDLKSAGVAFDILVDDTNSEMLEEIVEWLTVFEDKKVFIKKMNEKYAEKFCQNTIESLSNLVKRYKGWGRFSQKLLMGIRDNYQQNLIDYLLNDKANRNFMQLIHDKELVFNAEIERANIRTEKVNFNEIVQGLATSPAIKRGILQSLKLVDELVKYLGVLPKNIAIEFARENQSTALKDTRKEAIEKALQKLKEEFKGEYVFDKKELMQYENRDFLQRLQLYYLQHAKDMYTGKPILDPFDSNYEIDHIIPESLLKNDSLENKVLVHKNANANKGERPPGVIATNDAKALWKRLYNAGVLTNEKYARLRKTEFTEEDVKGFINRQLVETRQIMKNVATILKAHFVDEEGNQIVDILTPKSMFASALRKQNEWHKIRDLNDYHHAHDAYLNGVVALFRKKKNYDGVYQRILEKLKNQYPNRSQSRERATKLRQKSFQQSRDMDIKEYKKNKQGEYEWTGGYLERESWWNRKVLTSIESCLYDSCASSLPIITYKVEEQRGSLSKSGNLKAGCGTLLKKKNLSIALYGGSISDKNKIALMTDNGKVKAVPFVQFLKDKKKLLANGEVLKKFQLLKNVIYKLSFTKSDQKQLEKYYNGEKPKPTHNVWIKIAAYQKVDVNDLILKLSEVEDRRQAIENIISDSKMTWYRYLTSPKESQLAQQFVLSKQESNNLNRFLGQHEKEIELDCRIMLKMLDFATITGASSEIDNEKFLTAFKSLTKNGIKNKEGKEIEPGQIAVIKDLKKLIYRGTSRTLNSFKYEKFKDAGLKSDERYTDNNNRVNSNTTLIYQSVTGLYETRRALAILHRKT